MCRMCRTVSLHLQPWYRAFDLELERISFLPIPLALKVRTLVFLRHVWICLPEGERQFNFAGNFQIYSEALDAKVIEEEIRVDGPGIEAQILDKITRREFDRAERIA